MQKEEELIKYYDGHYLYEELDKNGGATAMSLPNSIYIDEAVHLIHGMNDQTEEKNHHSVTDHWYERPNREEAPSFGHSSLV
jgi:hypothetical protein